MSGRGLLLGAWFVALLFGESRRPLRASTERTGRRRTRNLVVAALGGPVMQLVELPLAERLCHLVAARRWGLLMRVPLPTWARVAAGMLLMDHTLYVWHRLTHRVPLLWRFHRVHHVDGDLDVTTALRFHAGELLASVPWRLAQVFVLGLPAPALRAWQTWLGVSVLFHHSNIRLPIRVERALVRLIVTPRMHGIHHSENPTERDSNWSSGLTIWDRLHGTLRLDVPQHRVRIGDAAHRSPADHALRHLLVMPLLPQRPDA